MGEQRRREGGQGVYLRMCATSWDVRGLSSTLLEPARQKPRGHPAAGLRPTSWRSWPTNLKDQNPTAGAARLQLEGAEGQRVVVCGPELGPGKQAGRAPG